MINLPLLLTSRLLQRSAQFGSDAPLGTGLEWMTVGSILLPALFLVLLVYLSGSDTT